MRNQPGATVSFNKKGTIMFSKIFINSMRVVGFVGQDGKSMGPIVIDVTNMEIRKPKVGDDKVCFIKVYVGSKNPSAQTSYFAGCQAVLEKFSPEPGRQSILMHGVYFQTPYPHFKLEPPAPKTKPLSANGFMEDFRKAAALFGFTHLEHSYASVGGEETFIIYLSKTPEAVKAYKEAFIKPLVGPGISYTPTNAEAFIGKAGDMSHDEAGLLPRRG